MEIINVNHENKEFRWHYRTFEVYYLGICVPLEFRCTRTYYFRRENNQYENDFTAEEAAENEGTRLQKENVYQEWQKRSEEKKSKRQKESNCLISLCFERAVNARKEETCWKEMFCEKKQIFSRFTIAENLWVTGSWCCFIGLTGLFTIGQVF